MGINDTSFGLNNFKNVNNPNSQGFLNALATLESRIQGVRVTDIILDDTHPNFSSYGGWNGIGTIEFENVNIEYTSPNAVGFAKPLLPYLKNYPLVNEIVLIFALPNNELFDEKDEKIFYYLNPISLWNHPHHNAYPNTIQSDQDEDLKNDYDFIEGGAVRRVKDESTDINLNSPKIGGTFVEKPNIHPVLPFAGDIIVEGRFGNSIRLGNTSKSKSIFYKNNWSGEGNNGDPITIIRNGQSPNSSNEGWKPVVENINEDLSSIYLTSTQRIPVKSEFPSFPSLIKNPASLTEYSKNQIILSSGRLVFNTIGDSIFFTSNKSISLNSTEDIALFSRNSNIALQGKEVKLGEKSAGEPIILGNKFMEGFDQLLFSLSILGEALLTEPCFTGASATAANMKQTADEMRSQLKDYLSKTVKSI